MISDRATFTLFAAKGKTVNYAALSALHELSRKGGNSAFTYRNLSQHDVSREQLAAEVKRARAWILENFASRASGK